MFHIIDDEPYLRELEVELLNTSGHQAKAYSSAIEYVEYLHSPDYIAPTAIFTDLTMPGMSGYELIDIVREKLVKQKVVIISGYSKGLANKKHKVCHFVSKPCNAEKFISLGACRT